MTYFVTGNKGKFVEALAIFGDLVQRDIGYTEIQADTLEEVALYGMKEVASRLQGAVMLEDAGLFVEALQGFSGRLLGVCAKDHRQCRDTAAHGGPGESIGLL